MTARDQARMDLVAYHRALITDREEKVRDIVKRWRLRGMQPLEISYALEAASHGHVLPNDEQMETSE